jgi:hypothetical protein
MLAMNPYPTFSLQLAAELSRERTRITRPAHRAKRARTFSDRRAMSGRGDPRQHAPSWPTA